MSASLDNYTEHNHNLLKCKALPENYQRKNETMLLLISTPLHGDPDYLFWRPFCLESVCVDSCQCRKKMTHFPLSFELRRLHAAWRKDAATQSEIKPPEKKNHDVRYFRSWRLVYIKSRYENNSAEILIFVIPNYAIKAF